MKKGIKKLVLGRITVILSLLFCIIFFTGCGRQKVYLETSEKQQDKAQEPEAGDGVTQETETSETVCVYICGAVKTPGLYTIMADSRIGDAVDAAGGMTGRACPDYWNLAERVTDGQMIRVPTKKEAAQMQQTPLEAEEGQQADGGDGKININTATKEQLLGIPGIGETRAEDIVTYRESGGKFSKIEDIMNVSGIKEGLFAKMKEYITVGG